MSDIHQSSPNTNEINNHLYVDINNNIINSSTSHSSSHLSSSPISDNSHQPLSSMGETSLAIVIEKPIINNTNNSDITSNHMNNKNNNNITNIATKTNKNNQIDDNDNHNYSVPVSPTETIGNSMKKLFKKTNPFRRKSDSRNGKDSDKFSTKSFSFIPKRPSLTNFSFGNIMKLNSHNKQHKSSSQGDASSSQSSLSKLNSSSSISLPIDPIPADIYRLPEIPEIPPDIKLDLNDSAFDLSEWKYDEKTNDSELASAETSPFLSRKTLPRKPNTPSASPEKSQPQNISCDNEKQQQNKTTTSESSPASSLSPMNRQESIRSKISSTIKEGAESVLQLKGLLKRHPSMHGNTREFSASPVDDANTLERTRSLKVHTKSTIPEASRHANGCVSAPHSPQDPVPSIHLDPFNSPLKTFELPTITEKDSFANGMMLSIERRLSKRQSPQKKSETPLDAKISPQTPFSSIPENVEILGSEVSITRRLSVLSTTKNSFDSSPAVKTTSWNSPPAGTALLLSEEAKLEANQLEEKRVQEMLRLHELMLNEPKKTSPLKEESADQIFIPLAVSPDNSRIDSLSPKQSDDVKVSTLNSPKQSGTILPATSHNQYRSFVNLTSGYDIDAKALLDPSLLKRKPVKRSKSFIERKVVVTPEDINLPENIENHHQDENITPGPSTSLSEKEIHAPTMDKMASDPGMSAEVETKLRRRSGNRKPSFSPSSLSHEIYKEEDVLDTEEIVDGKMKSQDSVLNGLAIHMNLMAVPAVDVNLSSVETDSTKPSVSPTSIKQDVKTEISSITANPKIVTKESNVNHDSFPHELVAENGPSLVIRSVNEEKEIPVSGKSPEKHTLNANQSIQETLAPSDHSISETHHKELLLSKDISFEAPVAHESRKTDLNIIGLKTSVSSQQQPEQDVQSSKKTNSLYTIHHVQNSKEDITASEGDDRPGQHSTDNDADIETAITSAVEDEKEDYLLLSKGNVNTSSESVDQLTSGPRKEFAKEEEEDNDDKTSIKSTSSIKKGIQWISTFVSFKGTKKKKKKEKNKEMDEQHDIGTTSQRNTINSTSDTTLTLPPDAEQLIYRLSHAKLSDSKRELVEQVLISNLMLHILSVRADLNLNQQMIDEVPMPKKKSKQRRRRSVSPLPMHPNSTSGATTTTQSASRRPGRKSLDSRPSFEEDTTRNGSINGRQDVLPSVPQEEELQGRPAVISRPYVPAAPLIQFDRPLTPIVDLTMVDGKVAENKQGKQAGGMNETGKINDEGAFARLIGNGSKSRRKSKSENGDLYGHQQPRGTGIDPSLYYHFPYFGNDSVGVIATGGNGMVQPPPPPVSYVDPNYSLGGGDYVVSKSTSPKCGIASENASHNRRHSIDGILKSLSSPELKTPSKLSPKRASMSGAFMPPNFLNGVYSPGMTIPVVPGATGSPVMGFVSLPSSPPLSSRSSQKKTMTKGMNATQKTYVNGRRHNRDDDDDEEDDIPLGVLQKRRSSIVSVSSMPNMKL